MAAFTIERVKRFICDLASAIYSLTSQNISRHMPGTTNWMTLTTKSTKQGHQSYLKYLEIQICVKELLSLAMTSLISTTLLERRLPTKKTF